MSKIDAFRLRPQYTEPSLYTFKDGNKELNLWLKPLTLIDKYLAEDRYEELKNSYLDTGEFPSLGTDNVRLSRHLLRIVSSIEVMQSEKHPECFYPAEQLIGFVCGLPRLWEQIVTACEGLCGLDGKSQEWMKLIEGSVRWGHWHPELVWRQDQLLWSINEKLGGREGAKLQPLSWQWLEELLSLEK